LAFVQGYAGGGLLGLYLVGMKKLLTAMFALAAFAGQAQTAPAAQPAAYPTDAATGRLDYTEAVPVEGVSKADLFTRAKVWLAGSFKSAKDVVQTEDKDAGIMVGKGYSTISLTMGRVTVPAKLFYTLKMNFKDGKYKYEFSDFYFENEPVPELGNRINKTPAETWVLAPAKDDRAGKVIALYKAQFDQTVQGLVASLKAGMLKSSDF